jgi:Zn-finger nucleic acid-binding protein
MTQVTFAGIQVERCTDCAGLFLDTLDTDRLRRMRGAASIDIGDPAVGREFNQVDQINCPRCGSRMIRMVDAQQHHIWFEHCTVCAGSFFDAGEFRDLTHHTLVDFFRDLATPVRS